MTSSLRWLGSPRGRQALHTELLRRRLIEFTLYTAPWYQPGNVHRFLAEQLEAVERGDIRRLMVFMPPRTGKTELLVRWLAWCLGRHPDWPMLYTSYAADLAWEKSGDCRGVVASEEYGEIFGARRLVEVRTSPDVALAKDSRAVQRWRIAGQRGGLQAQGVGGPITGKGGMMIVVDDPVKNRQEADSAAHRQSTWNWYTSTLRTRLEPGGRIVVVMTRWHEDDLAGRLLQRAADDPEADQWHVVKLAGLAKGDDPLGRAPGEALDPQRYDRPALLQTKASIGERDWASLYDQEPRQKEGNVFKQAWFRYVDTLPKLQRAAVVWDTAFESKETSDFSACGLVGQGEDGAFYVQPLVRERLEFPELVASAQAQVTRWPNADHCVEARASGKSLRQQMRLHGLPLVEIEPAGDKVARANSVTKYFEAGLVSLVNGPLVDGLVHELLTFPSGSHDDQVDWLVYGLLRLTQGGPVQQSENPFYG
jgi:predicted phage terminase large subunit-like protein